MNDLFSVFASDLLPIFVIAGAGFALARWLGASATTLTHVVFYALLPCFAFRLLVTAVESGRQFGRMVLLAVLVMLVMAAVGALVSLALRLGRSESMVFLLVVMFSNGGNYGLPVVSFAFGNEALSYGTVFFLTGSVLTSTVGAFLAAAGRRSVRKAAASVLGMPALYGIAAAMVVLATGITVPPALLRPVTMLSDAALPLMILVLGMQLERAAFPKRPALVVTAVCVSLLVAPLVALGLTSLLHVTGAARQAAVVLSSMPVAVATTILALEFDASPDFVTGAVFLSTILSPITLTPLIAYLR
ncbi:MAG: AEC family transporter [Vicinamibacterales bacterium]|nr:AEC family transporter [Vicinamibacterales bacterium]